MNIKKSILFVITMFLFSLPAYGVSDNVKCNVYKASGISVDGDLSDWSDYMADGIALPSKQSNVSYINLYGGSEDLCGLFWFAWDNYGLYIAAEINDDSHYIVNGDGCWEGDSIQFAVGIDNSYGPEYAISTENVAYRYSDGSATAGANSVSVASSINGNVTNIEIFFPWNTLASSRPKSSMPFSILLNENDGDGRIGWIEHTPGIATSKVADKFGVMYFLDELPSYGEKIKIPDIKAEMNSSHGNSTIVTVVRNINTVITYPDIAYHWAKSDIEKMCSLGIARGYGELFIPDGTITRSEYVCMLARAINLDDAEYFGTYSDVYGDNWYAKKLQALTNAEIILPQLIIDGMFMPDKLLTREEMTVLAVNAYLKMRIETLKLAEPNFADINSISDYAKNYITLARELNIITGDENQRFCPKELSSRAETVTVVSRLYDLLINSVSEGK